MSIETLVQEITDAHPKKYVDLYEIDEEEETIDPLMKVVPTSTFFFGTYSLHFLIFTKLYLNDDDEFDVTGSKQRLIDTFHLFAKYEVHIFIQSDAVDIQNAPSNRLNTFHNLLAELAAEMVDYGIVYHGQQSEVALRDTVNEVIQSWSILL